MNSDDAASHGHSFRDLTVWQRARQLAVATKGITDKFSPRGTFILGDQMLRAAVSVPGNIAEGRGRLSKADNVRHLCIARGSLNELLSHVILAVDYDFTSAANSRVALDLGDEVGRMLNAQIRTLGTRRLR
jgi:four helix bundle protein